MTRKCAKDCSDPDEKEVDQEQFIFSISLDTKERFETGVKFLSTFGPREFFASSLKRFWELVSSKKNQIPQERKATAVKEHLRNVSVHAISDIQGIFCYKILIKISDPEQAA